MPNCTAPTAWSSSQKPLGIAQCGIGESCQGLRNEWHQKPIAGIVIHQSVCRLSHLKTNKRSSVAKGLPFLLYSCIFIHHGTSQCKLNEADDSGTPTSSSFGWQLNVGCPYLHSDHQLSSSCYGFSIIRVFWHVMVFGWWRSHCLSRWIGACAGASRSFSRPARILQPGGEDDGRNWLCWFDRTRAWC